MLLAGLDRCHADCRVDSGLRAPAPGRCSQCQVQVCQVEVSGLSGSADSAISMLHVVEVPCTCVSLPAIIIPSAPVPEYLYSSRRSRVQTPPYRPAFTLRSTARLFRQVPSPSPSPATRHIYHIHPQGHSRNRTRVNFTTLISAVTVIPTYFYVPEVSTISPRINKHVGPAILPTSSGRISPIPSAGEFGVPGGVLTDHTSPLRQTTKANPVVIGCSLMVSLPHKVTTLRKVKCNINSSSLLLSRVVAGMDASKGA